MWALRRNEPGICSVALAVLAFAARRTLRSWMEDVGTPGP